MVKKTPTEPVSVECDPTNITMGVAVPPLPILTQIIVTPPPLQLGIAMYYYPKVTQIVTILT